MVTLWWSFATHFGALVRWGCRSHGPLEWRHRWRGVDQVNKPSQVILKENCVGQWNSMVNHLTEIWKTLWLILPRWMMSFYFSLHKHLSVYHSYTCEGHSWDLGRNHQPVQSLGQKGWLNACQAFVCKYSAILGTGSACSHFNAALIAVCHVPVPVTGLQCTPNHRPKTSQDGWHFRGNHWLGSWTRVIRKLCWSVWRL